MPVLPNKMFDSRAIAVVPDMSPTTTNMIIVSVKDLENIGHITCCWIPFHPTSPSNKIIQSQQQQQHKPKSFPLVAYWSSVWNKLQQLNHAMALLLSRGFRPLLACSNPIMCSAYPVSASRSYFMNSRTEPTPSSKILRSERLANSSVSS